MKKYIILMITLLGLSSKAQTVEIGTDLFGEGAMIDHMIVTNSGDIFLAMMNNSGAGEIEVHKYDGVSWSNSANSGTFVDSLARSFQLLYNPENDSIFLGYVKADGFYLRTYTASWSSAEYYPCSPAMDGYNDYMLSTLDKAGNSPYFLFEDVSDNLSLLSFDGSSFSEVSVPSFTYNVLEVADLLYNPEDGFIYYAHNNLTTGIIERYNGIGWSDLDDNVTASGSHLFLNSNLLMNPGTNEIICLYSHNSGSGPVSNRCGINVYNSANNDKTILLPEFAENGGGLGGGAILGDTFYADFGVQGYTGTSSEIFWNMALTSQNYIRDDYHFDNQGYLYWKANIGTSENVYRSGPFVLGGSGLELSEPTSIYPNPATNQIQITSDELQTATFYSIDGALIVDGYEISKSQPLNIDFLSKGLYIVKLTNAEGVVSQQRVVVE